MTMSLNEILWSTRGFEWDFRILRNPHENRDWLLVYDEFFKGTEYEDRFFAIREASTRSPQKEQCIALRFPDPQNRKDRPGRLIPHEFVIFGKSAEGIESWEQARDAVWPLVEEEYSTLYDTNPFRAPRDDETDTVVTEKNTPDTSPHRGAATIIVFLAMLGALLYAFYPNGTVNVRGSVTFSDGTPLHMGTIVWATEGTTRTTSVDEKGNYRLDRMKPGKYAVSFKGETVPLIDPKYLEAETSGFVITLNKPFSFGGTKERTADLSIEKNHYENRKTHY